jgi:hypothetical protein
MRWKIAVLGLAVLGLALVVASYNLNSYNSGFCPETTSMPSSFLWFGGFCDHTMTLSGLTFHIRQTAEGIFGVGLISLISGLAIGLYGMSRHMVLTKSRISS